MSSLFARAILYRHSMPHIDMLGASGPFRAFAGVGISWDDARSRCAAMDMSLAYAADEAENKMLGSILTQPAWIGLSYNGTSWVWCDGGDTAYVAWEVDEPNNYAGDEYCVEIDEGAWNDVACDYEFIDAYICRLGRS